MLLSLFSFWIFILFFLHFVFFRKRMSFLLLFFFTFKWQHIIQLGALHWSVSFVSCLLFFFILSNSVPESGKKMQNTANIIRMAAIHTHTHTYISNLIYFLHLHYFNYTIFFFCSFHFFPGLIWKFWHL